MNHHEEFKRVEPIEPPLPPYDISDYSLSEQAGIILWLFREAVSILVANHDDRSLKSLEQRIADFCGYMIQKEIQQDCDSVAQDLLRDIKEIDELMKG